MKTIPCQSCGLATARGFDHGSPEECQLALVAEVEQLRRIRASHHEDDHAPVGDATSDAITLALRVVHA